MQAPSLTTSQAAERMHLAMNARDMARACGVSERTLFTWREKHGFPFSETPTGKIVYPVDPARKWLARHLRTVKAGA